MNEKTPAVTTHVLGIFTLFLGPLVMYFAFRRNASPWLRAHLDESVNYHILVLAAFVLLIIAAVVLTNVGWPTLALIAAILGIIIFLASLLLGIVAAVKAGKGKDYHFPLDLKIIR